MNEVMKSLLSHQSIRAYTEQMVEEEKIVQIIQAVQAAPNWNNLQHVSVIVVKEAKRKEMFSRLCGGQKQIAQAPVFLIFCADFYRTWLACGKEEHFAETMKQLDNICAIEEAIQDGKVRSAGVSCYYIRETNRFLPKAGIKPALVQNEIHPYYQDSRVIRHIQSLDLAVQSWYPLGGRGYTKVLLENKTLCQIAAVHGKSPAQVILRWDLQRGVIVIPGSSNEKHICENISIFDFKLTNEEMERIAALNKDEKHDWY